MYGKETSVEVAKIYKIYNAINSIGNIDWLGWDTSYSLSRLHDQAETIIKAVNKEKQKHQKTLQAELKEAGEDKDKKTAAQEKYITAIQGIDEKTEVIGIPPINIEEFKCKKAFKTLVKVVAEDGKEYTETKEFAENQILVHQSFLNLMGEFIVK